VKFQTAGEGMKFWLQDRQTVSAPFIENPYFFDKLGSGDQTLGLAHML
jgi:hypothetical protein